MMSAQNGGQNRGRQSRGLRSWIKSFKHKYNFLLLMLRKGRLHYELKILNHMSIFCIYSVKSF